jgi:hypothetical protein
MIAQRQGEPRAAADEADPAASRLSVVQWKTSPKNPKNK